MSLPLGDVLIGDNRLQTIEARLRHEFHGIPETAVFVTWVQPEQWVEVEGILRKLPECAVLSIIATSPRDSRATRVFRAGTTLTAWRSEEWGSRHDSGFESDPAYRALRRLVPEVIEYDTSLRALLN